MFLRTRWRRVAAGLEETCLRGHGEDVLLRAKRRPVAEDQDETCCTAIVFGDMKRRGRYGVAISTSSALLSYKNIGKILLNNING